MDRSRSVGAAVRVRVPATSANLGPGFDAFGLALALYDDVVVRVTDTGLQLKVYGEGVDQVGRGEDHLVVASLRAAFDLLGGQPPGLQVVCTNRIPQSRGLGSSAAAIVAGVTAAFALATPASPDAAGAPERDRSGGSFDGTAALALAARLEGHPDNVAACLLGGLTIAWSSGDATHAVGLEPSADLAPVMLVPTAQASTATARAALPATVAHADAAANACRAALLVLALTGRPELLFDATQDRIHQDARASSMPATAQLVRDLRADGIPAVVSGAGPTVLAFSAGDLAAYAGPGWRQLRLPVAGRATTVLH